MPSRGLQWQGRGWMLNKIYAERRGAEAQTRNSANYRTRKESRRHKLDKIQLFQCDPADLRR